MDKKMKVLLAVVAGAAAGIFLVCFLHVNCGVQMTLISGMRDVCLLTNVPASYELEYYSPAGNKVRVYDENGREVRAEYMVKGDRVRLRFSKRFVKNEIYHCTLRKGDAFIGTAAGGDLSEMRTLYFTRMNLWDRRFKECRNETWIAGTDLRSAYQMRGGRIRLGKVRLFLQNRLTSWKEKVDLDEFEHEIYMDGRKIDLSGGLADCGNTEPGPHMFEIKVTGMAQKMQYQKQIEIIE